MGRAREPSVNELLALVALRVRGHRLAGAEQRLAVGVGDAVRLPPHAPARRWHGDRDRCAGAGCGGRDRRAPRCRSRHRGRAEGRGIGIPPVRRLSRARERRGRPSDISHPLSLWQGVAFQWVNPKAWVFTIAAVGTFLPPAAPSTRGSRCSPPSLMVWSWGRRPPGQPAAQRLVRSRDERTRRTINIVLAVLLVASVALIWM